MRIERGPIIAIYRIKAVDCAAEEQKPNKELVRSVKWKTFSAAHQYNSRETAH